MTDTAKRALPKVGTDGLGRVQALIEWMDYEIEYHQSQCDSINPDIEPEEFRSHDLDLLRLLQLRKALLALNELVDLKLLKERIDGYEFTSVEEISDAHNYYLDRKPIAWQNAKDAILGYGCD